MRQYRISIFGALCGLFFSFSAFAQMGGCDAIPAWSGFPDGAICAGDTVVIYNESQNATTWFWDVNGQIIANTDSIVIPAMQLGNLSLALSATDISECTEVLSGQIPVVGIENLMLNAADTVSLCEGGSIQISTIGTFDAYTWSNGSNDPFIFADETQEVWVEAEDFESGCSAISNTVLVQVFPDPNPIVEIDGEEVFCEGDTVYLSTQEFASYEWPNGDTTAVLAVTSPGYYAVDVVNEFGCDSQSDLIQLQMNPAPDPELTIEGDVEFCIGDSLDVIFLVDSIWTNVEWQDGSSSNSFEPEMEGDFFACVIDINGCQGCTETVSVSYFPEPTIDEVMVQDISEVPGCDGIIEVEIESEFDPVETTWFLDGTEFAQDTQVIENLCSAGPYFLNVAYAEGCSFTWTVTLDIVSSVYEHADSWRVYPVPAHDELHISGLGNHLAYAIYDMKARKIKDGWIVNSLIDLDGMESGMYVLEVNGTRVKFLKE